VGSKSEKRGKNPLSRLSSLRLKEVLLKVPRERKEQIEGSGGRVYFQEGLEKVYLRQIAPQGGKGGLREKKRKEKRNYFYAFCRESNLP